jgi:hypothetical protein
MEETMRPFIFKYTHIGDTCLVDQKMMGRLYRYLQRFGIAVNDVPSKNNTNPNRRGKIKRAFQKRKAGKR